MRNILITGGCGFIGSHFINLLFQNDPDCHIINIDAMKYCANEYNVIEQIRNSERYKLVRGNILDSDLLGYIMNENRITHVVHFAAQSHVQNSFDNSMQFTIDNVLGTHTLLEACRIYGQIKKFIHISTDEVYGESMLDINEQHKYEHSVLCPTNPYAATKAAAELIVQSYHHSFKIPVVITRGNNVYGPNQYPEKLIPRFIQQLLTNERVTIQGTGDTVRAFMHVLDTVRAIFIILQDGIIGEIYNIGCDTGMEYSVMDVARTLISKIKHTDEYEKWITFIPDRPFNDARYYISNHKLKQLGWGITISFHDGINELIEISKKNIHGTL